MNAVAIIPAAGRGERLGAHLPKTLVELRGRPVIVHTLAVFERVAGISGVILVVPPEFVDVYRRVVERYGMPKVLAVVAGGATRTCSVRNGLSALPSEADYVVVHDGARPLVTVATVERGLHLALQAKALVAAVPVKPTIKVVDPATQVIRQTLDRSLLWEIQTPQIFERALLERAYADGAEATDDAALVERLGVPVKVFPGDYDNLKITTPGDMPLAEALLAREESLGLRSPASRPVKQKEKSARRGGKRRPGSIKNGED
ncbi:MAG: 2-C-methyl-D-erythritol 4-phosphate cytidylyltransferase [Candidatus Omnitrophica bacterium]|nr:2-C-methyl-D-erythritol 4-phosphate cytidylyltransferase [Candidatus Omnitrophota bacterium]